MTNPRHDDPAGMPATAGDPPRAPATPAAAQSLMKRLEAMPLCDREGAYAFEERLADEQGWSLGYARAVTREYRRFLVLAALAGHPVCPSEDVDQAWHLHVTQTRAYERLCREVLGRFLHHDPSRGGSAETAKHRAMYEDTKRSYDRLFDERPPEATWPSTDARFAPPRSASLPTGVRPPFRLPLGARTGVLALGTSIATGLLLTNSPVFDVWHAWAGPRFLGYEVLALLVLGLLARLTRHLGEAPPRGGVVLDTYEAAWLVHGERRVAAVAAAALVDRGLMRPAGFGGAVDRPKDTDLGLERTTIDPEALLALHPVERALMSVPHVGPLHFPDLRRGVAGVSAAIGERLGRAGLARASHWIPGPRAVVVALAMAAMAIAVERLSHAILFTRREHNLLWPLLIAHAVLLLLLLRLPGDATRRARAMLEGWTKRTRRIVATGRRLPRSGDAGLDPAMLSVATAVALMGAPALAADPRFVGMDRTLGREGFAGSGSSGSSGDSSSGCGGGSSCGGGGCGGGGCGG